MKTPFDPHLRICTGSLAHIKVIEGTNIFGTFWTRVKRYLYSASRVKARHDVSVLAYLDELDRTGSCLVKQASQSQDPPWHYMLEAENLHRPLLEVGQWVVLHPLDIGSFGSTFLSLMVHYGIVDFIRERPEKGCLVHSPYYLVSNLWPLLADAVEVKSFLGNRLSNRGPQADMIACLLEKGANPNFLVPGTGTSAWFMTLKHTREDYDGHSLKAPWPTIARLMFDHGAKMNKDMFPSLRAYGQPLKWTSINPEKRDWLEIEKLLFQELSVIRRASEKARSSWRVWL